MYAKAKETGMENVNLILSQVCMCVYECVCACMHACGGVHKVERDWRALRELSARMASVFARKDGAHESPCHIVMHSSSCTHTHTHTHARAHTRTGMDRADGAPVDLKEDAFSKASSK